MAPPHPRPGRRPGALSAVPLGAALLGVLLVSGCGGRSTPGPAASAAAAAPSATATRVTEAVPAKQAGRPSAEPPRTVRLPNGVLVPVRAVSTRTDGVLDVPENVRDAGWWRGGAQIGDPFGTTLLAGHVDSKTQGLGRFVALLSVRPGQRVVVTTRSLRQTFSITALRLIPQGSLEHRSWIYRPSGPRRLVMVTCAGPYDPATGYQRLAVIVARPDGDAVTTTS